MEKNVVAYCRVSTDKEDQLNSFEAQKEFFTEYAKQNNYNMIRIYADEGITGTSTKKRAEFNLMMKDSKNGSFDCVLVKDVSRLARNTYDFLKSIRELKARNINVRFVTANMETLDGSEFMLTMLAAMAQEESANMSKRVKFGKSINAEKGRVPNLCYGYIKTKGDYFNLQINEEEAEVVREIFDLYVDQGYGTHKISMLLNERGLTSLRGVPWSTTAVSRILKNKLYAGYVVNGKSEVSDFIEKTRRKKEESEWIEIERPELQIVPPEIWEKAQNVNKSNNSGLETTLHIKRSNKHLFSTLINCSVCGYSFRQSRRKRKSGANVIWCCSGRNHHGAGYCSNMTTIPESELIENLDSFFLALIKDKQSFIDNIISQYQKEQPKDQGTALFSQLEVIKNKKQKQIQLFENDIISIAELKERTADIDRQIAHIRVELDSAESQEDIEKKSRQLYRTLSENFSRYSSVAGMTNAELKMLIKAIIADENGCIRIELNY